MMFTKDKRDEREHAQTDIHTQLCLLELGLIRKLSEAIVGMLEICLCAFLMVQVTPVQQAENASRQCKGMIT
jgi:hypothetical protein